MESWLSAGLSLFLNMTSEDVAVKKYKMKRARNWRRVTASDLLIGIAAIEGKSLSMFKKYPFLMKILLIICSH